MATTYNYLPQNTFELKIDKLPEMSFYVTDLILPDVRINEIEVGFPGSNLIEQGNQINFGPLDVTFIVDEAMATYDTLFKWVEGQRYGGINSKEWGGVKTDAILHLMSANSTAGRIVQFSGLFPISVGNLTLNTQNSTIEYVTCNATFGYTSFDFK